MGTEGKRKLRLRNKPNAELFTLYESQLALKHRSTEALHEAKRVLHHFHVFLGQYPPSPEIATSFLSQYVSKKPTTLYRYHSIVNGFMTWYGEKLETKIRVPETLPDYIEQAQVDKLIEGLKESKTHKGVIERNVLLVELATKTGLRRGELAKLKGCDIDLKRMDLVVRQGKGQKDRIVNLAPSLAISLERYMKGKLPEEKLFDLVPGSISNMIRRVAKKCGVDLHTHSLRDFFATGLVDRGVDMEVVRRLLGHKNLTVTSRYLARTDTQRRDAINSLDRPLLQPDAPIIPNDNCEDLPLGSPRKSPPGKLVPGSGKTRPISKLPAEGGSSFDDSVEEMAGGQRADLNEVTTRALTHALSEHWGSLAALAMKVSEAFSIPGLNTLLTKAFEDTAGTQSPLLAFATDLLEHLEFEDPVWRTNAETLGTAMIQLFAVTKSLQDRVDAELHFPLDSFTTDKDIERLITKIGDWPEWVQFVKTQEQTYKLAKPVRKLLERVARRRSFDGKCASCPA